MCPSTVPHSWRRQWYIGTTKPAIGDDDDDATQLVKSFWHLGAYDVSINQSINHLLVLKSTKKQVDAQYSVEQDINA